MLYGSSPYLPEGLARTELVVLSRCRASLSRLTDWQCSTALAAVERRSLKPSTDIRCNATLLVLLGRSFPRRPSSWRYAPDLCSPSAHSAKEPFMISSMNNTSDCQTSRANLFAYTSPPINASCAANSRRATSNSALKATSRTLAPSNDTP